MTSKLITGVVCFCAGFAYRGFVNNQMEMMFDLLRDEEDTPTGTVVQAEAVEVTTPTEEQIKAQIQASVEMHVNARLSAVKEESWQAGWAAAEQNEKMILRRYEEITAAGVPPQGQTKRTEGAEK